MNENKPPTTASVITGEVTVSSSSTAQASGQVVTDGNATVSERGVVLKESSAPTIADTKIVSGSGIGVFSVAITGLQPGKTYYLRAFATNSAGTSYGLEKNFTTTAVLPTITTTLISELNFNAATSGGNISSDGGGAITKRGVCWSTKPSPTIADSSLVSGTGSGNFTSKLSNLKSGTNYYVRAYATNTAGTAYGNELTLVTPVLKDVEGNNYQVVTIGTQIWMAENLRVSKYRNGDPIPEVKNAGSWVNQRSGAFVYYNLDSNNNIPYGKLYNWYTVVDSRELCPSGWHVPSDGEWTVLSDQLGGLSVAGAKLKQTGTSTWAAPNIATNETGFNAVPNGCRCNPQADFGNGPQPPVPMIGAVFWTKTEADAIFSWFRGIPNSNERMDRSSNYKYYGFGVRCLKD